MQNPAWENQWTRHPVQTWAALTVGGTLLVVAAVELAVGAAAIRIPLLVRGGAGIAATGVCFAAGTVVDTPEGEKPIEMLRVGDRVRTSGDDKSGETSIDPATWRDVHLRMPNPDGSGDVIEVEVLRPSTWIEEVGAARGQWISFGLPEMGLHGPAMVDSISPTPAIQAGPGRVVRATVTHLNSQLHVLKFREVRDVLEPTATHRLYSIDRQSWVPTAELKAGERLWAEGGPVTVASNVRKVGTEQVYNIEVETAHSYLVGDARILSHNENPCEVAAEGAEHIALGLEHVVEEQAASVGATHLMNDPNWKATFMDALAGGSTKFTVFLDNLVGRAGTIDASAYDKVMTSVLRNATAVGGATDFEISQLYQAGRLGSVTFMQGGGPVSNPFQ